MAYTADRIVSQELQVDRSFGPSSGRPPQAARNIADAIARWSTTKGSCAALVACGGPEVTFAQLARSIAFCAAQLQSAGLRREDRVGLVVPPGVSGGQLAVALASNATLVPMNPSLTAHEVTQFSRETGLRAVVVAHGVETAARSAMVQEPVTVLEARLAHDGMLALHLLGPQPEAHTPLRPAREDDVALLLRSSGTNGAPKLIPVTHGNLLAMADRLGSELWFRLGAEDRAACLLPLYYAAGLKTSLLVPLILGASVGFPVASAGVDITQWLPVLKPTYLSVAPGSLNGIVDRLRASAARLDPGPLRFVMCGAAYLPEHARLEAESMLHAPVLEFYGLTEAGVMAANPLPPRRNKPGSVGLPVPEELVLVDENGRQAQNGAVGQIMISGPTVTPGYLTSEDVTAGKARDGWLLTGDLGRIDEDGYLTIVGRVKEVINRGGEKVFPYEVEKAMLRHPAVLEAAAFGVPHPRFGESVAAAAVLKPGSAISEDELKAFLAGRLAGFKLPRTVRFLPSLPRGNTGKVLRSSLSQAYASSRRLKVEANDLLEVELRDLWARLLGARDIGVHDDFLDIGGDSLLATEMLLEVERLTGKPYPQSELSTLTIRRIADVVTSGLALEPRVITQAKPGSGVPFFFCHGDYFTRGIYAHKLAALVPGNHPVFLLHYHPDCLAGCSMEQIAEGYVDDVLRVSRGAPVFVGGWCNGGLAAWHLAHLLRSRGVDVAQLLLIDTLSLNAGAQLRRLAGVFERMAVMAPGAGRRFLREKAMSVVWAAGRRSAVDGLKYLLGGAARAITKGVGHQVEPLRGADRNAARTNQLWILAQRMARYIPPSLDAEVTCFIAKEGARFDTDPERWKKIAPKVNEVPVPGTHLTAVVSEREALAAAIGKVLERCTGERQEKSLV